MENKTIIELEAENAMINLFMHPERQRLNSKILGQKRGAPIQYENWYDTVEISSLTYHSNWNKLMPVVEKIESMGFKVVILGNTCSIYNSQYNVQTFEAETKIEATCNHIIDFIQWYTSQPLKA